MTQIPIIGSDGKPVRYAYLDNNELKFVFEYYERTEGEGDYEIIHTVAPKDFASIAIKFGLNPDLDILTVIQQITDVGKGEELKDALNSKEIENEIWTWLS
jgi:thiamine monophosphate kinase